MAVNDSSKNGKIVINDTEIVVYDDSGIQTEIDQHQSRLNELDQEKHTHSNKATLDKIEQTGSESSIDLSKLSTYETAINDLTTLRHSHSNKPTLDRLGISSSNKLTIDGEEQVNTEYTHPESHPASMITEDEGHRFVTDVEKVEWNSKAEEIHKHRLEDITDLDISNKSDGYILQYDSVIEKFVSKASLENIGGGKLDDLSDVDVSSIQPVEGDTLLFQEGVWKPNSATSTNYSYIIDLDKWGIVSGIPPKPYLEEDFFQADQNIVGINRALNFASSNNYSEVVLPRGEYALCYPREIEIPSRIHFNLNGSTLKVIYDSDFKSPFDTRTTNDYYNFKGNSIAFSNSHHSMLSNGIVKGCREDRSFRNPGEVSQEHTYGVLFKRGSSFCSIKNCSVSDYMGDNITFSSDSVAAYAEFNNELTLNNLDPNTGQLVPSNNTVVTRFINLPLNLDMENTIVITGAGYSRQTNFSSRDFHIFWYTEDNSFIGSMLNRKIYTPLTIPINAKKFRLIFLNETNINKNMQYVIRWGNIPHHNLVEYCEVYNGHRGGITLGGSYNVIQHNVIRDNGKVTTRFLDGKPMFNDPTRYSINQEDSYGDNCVIRNNLIYGSYHGILCGCYSLKIEDNHFYNIDNIAINIYSMLYGIISGNFFYNCLSNVGLMTSHFAAAFLNVSGNSFHSGKLDLTSSTYEVLLANNNFVDPTMVKIGDNGTFLTNHIHFINPPLNPFIDVPKIMNSTFISNSQTQKIFYYTKEFIDCKFKGGLVDLVTRDNNSAGQIITLNSCKFNNCEVRNHTFSKGRIVEISNSKLIDTKIEIGLTNTINQNSSTTLKYCEVEVVLNDHIFKSDCNRPLANFIIERSNVKIFNSSFAYLLKSGNVNKCNSLTIKETEIRYLGNGQLTLKYYSNKNNIEEVISSKNKFLNIALLPEDEEIYIGFDPLKESPVEPYKGEYVIGDIIYNTRPEIGGFVGWICIRTGIANNNPWVEDTNYNENTIINSNGHVYKCITGGTSGTARPTHTSGVVPDGTLQWEYVNDLAIFKRFGLIEE
ncbi:hypothetical protein ACRTEV_21780 [Rossellomorea arthrocnemi]